MSTSVSPWQRLRWAFYAAVATVSAPFMDVILKETWVPGWARDNPGRMKVACLLVALGFQVRVIYAGRPGREAFAHLLRENLTHLHAKDPRVRVSLLAVRSYRWWQRVWDWWHRAKDASKLPRKYLKVVGRAPEDDTGCSIRFHKREGVAGLAWALEGTCVRQDLPDPKLDEAAWIRYSEEQLGLRPEKARRVVRKCRSYVSCPVFDGDSTRVRGILCVDSLDEDYFTKQVQNALERFARYLSHVPF